MHRSCDRYVITCIKNSVNKTMEMKNNDCITVCSHTKDPSDKPEYIIAFKLVSFISLVSSHFSTKTLLLCLKLNYFVFVKRYTKRFSLTSVPTGNVVELFFFNCIFLFLMLCLCQN